MPRTAKKPINEAFKTGAPAATPVASGMPYGQRQALEQSLAQAPIPGPQQTNVAQQPGGVSPEALQAAQQTPFQPVGMFNPSQQPGVPVTAGLVSGPGPGPEALTPPPNPDAQALQGLVPLLEILSSGPNSTYATRNFLRTIQAAGAQ